MKFLCRNELLKKGRGTPKKIEDIVNKLKSLQEQVDQFEGGEDKDIEALKQEIAELKQH
jgi:peptidoglycan hydrolase CwlO-like protein